MLMKLLQMLKNNELLKKFYLNEDTNIHNVKLSEIWDWDYEELELNHNYIQWLFPLNEKSNYNLFAPVLSINDIEEFSTNEVIKQNIIQSFRVILDFYGLSLIEDIENKAIFINKAVHYEVRKSEWITSNNHNYLRITRILRCLYLLKLDIYSDAFLESLTTIYSENENIISETSYQYWLDSKNI